MSDLADFHSNFIPRQAEAEAAIVQGDLEPRLALWTRREPVSLFGAWGPCKYDWAEVERVFRWVTDRFSDPADERYDFHYDIEVLDVVGDMAYTVGFEHFKASIAGGPPEDVTVRVTHIYRREDGEWKIVHRHGDLAPVDQSPPQETASAER
jgi:hypothetical protein